MIQRGYSHTEYADRFNEYPAWENVRFDKLLARGAIEVSASLKDGAMEFIKIRSIKGGRVRVTSPYALDKIAPCKDNIIGQIQNDTGHTVCYKYRPKNHQV